MVATKFVKKNSGKKIASILLLCGVLAGCSKNPAELQKKFLSEGQHYLSEGKTSEAVIEFQNLLKVNPHSTQGHYWLGKAYLKKGWVLESVQQFKETSREDPLFLGAHIELAKYGVNSSQWSAVKPEIEAILKIDPNNADGWAMSGQRASALGREEEAQKDLNHALSLDPKSVRALVALGDLDRHKNHPNQAESSYQKALVKDPGNSRAWTGLGFVAQALKQTGEASKDFEKAVEVDPSDLRSLIILANFTAQQGHVKKAIAMLEAIPAKKTDIRIPVKIAEYETLIGENDKVIQLLHPFVRQKIQIPDIDFVLAKAYQQSGKKQEALDMVDRLLKMGGIPLLMKISAARTLASEGKPDESLKVLDSLGGLSNLPLLYWLTKGQDEMRLNREFEAIRTVDEALKLYPDDPHLLLTLVDAQALGKHDKTAIGILSRLLGKDPKNPAFISRMGTLLGRTRGTGAEIAYYRDASRKYPEVAAVEVLYILSLATNRKLPGAAREADAYLGTHPDNQAIRFLLAQFYLQTGQEDQAIKTYKAILEKDPNNIQTLGGLAFQELRSHHNASAESFYRRALAIAPDDPNLNAGLGEALLAQNQRKEAMGFFRKSLSENPGQTIALIEVAKFEIFSGEPRSALGRLAPLLKAPLPPENKAEVQWLFGLASEGSNNFDGARKALEEAVRLDPSNAGYHASLGTLWSSASQWDKAIPEFNRSLALHPGDPSVLLQRNWARVNVAKGDPKREQIKSLIVQASNYWEKNPEDLSAGLIVAKGELIRKDPAKALMAFDKILAKHSQNTEALLGKSDILLAQGNTKQAEKLAEQILSDNPNNLRGNLILASIDEKNKNLPGEISRLEKVHQIAPDWVQPALTLASADLSGKNYAEAKSVAFSLHEAHPDLTVALFLQANAEMGLGEYRNALRDFKSLSNNGKKSAPLYNLISMAAGKLGDQEEQKKYLDLALRIAPDDPIILNNMAFALAMNGQHLSRALGYARKALSKANQPIIQDTVGYVLYRMGRFSEAEPLFKTAYEARFRDPEFLFHMGMNESKLGNKNEASDLLKKAVLTGSLLPEEQSQAQKVLRTLSQGGD